MRKLIANLMIALLAMSFVVPTYAAKIVYVSGKKVLHHLPNTYWTGTYKYTEHNDDESVTHTIKVRPYGKKMRATITSSGPYVQRTIHADARPGISCLNLYYSHGVPSKFKHGQFLMSMKLDEYGHKPTLLTSWYALKPMLYKDRLSSPYFKKISKHYGSSHQHAPKHEKTIFVYA